jgi:CheY-like chemotaxis protein
VALKRILIVDDEEDIRSFLSEYLESHGFPCEQASNGIEALEKLGSIEIHLVISDVRMPQLDGIGLLRAIRKNNPNFPPVILMSAFTNFNFEEARELGAFALISKPFPMSVIMESVLLALK